MNKNNDKDTDKTKGKNNLLFSIIGALFNNKNYINNLTDETKRQYLFMILRRLAIKYPDKCNAFNVSNVNANDVIQYWSDFLYNGFKEPNWIYTPGAVKSKNIKEEKNSGLKSADIKAYKEYKKMGNKEFDDYMNFFPEYITKEVLDYKELIKDS